MGLILQLTIIVPAALFHEQNHKNAIRATHVPTKLGYTTLNCELLSFMDIVI